jgi:oligosaccharide translocation protein RFT1
MMNWRALLPSLGVVVAFAAAAVCTRWSEAAYAGVRLSVMAQKGHIAVGGVCLVVCLLSWCVSLLSKWIATVF